MNAHPTKRLPAPIQSPSGGHTLRPDHPTHDTQWTNVESQPLTDDHRVYETHSGSVVGDLLDPGQPLLDADLRSAGVEPSADDQKRTENQDGFVVGNPSGQPPSDVSSPHISGGGWLELRIWAEMFDDAQKARIAATNRAERGGVDADIYAAYLDSLKRAEHECGLAMRRCLRRVVPAPILAWQKASNGIGEHLLARLLGHLGHPVWAEPHHWEGSGTNRVLITDPPFARTVGQLWQFCGHGRPERKRKGMTADELAAMGNPTLKMVLHLLAEACMKTRTSPYRLTYEQARLASADKVHTVECVRCGPSGKPAQVGDPWSPGHQHAHALRIVGKEILRDLWMVAGGAA